MRKAKTDKHQVWSWALHPQKTIGVHPGAVSMRVSFALRSAEACRNAQCITNSRLSDGQKLVTLSDSRLGPSCQLRSVPGRSPSPVLARPYIASQRSSDEILFFRCSIVDSHTLPDHVHTPLSEAQSDSRPHLARSSTWILPITFCTYVEHW